MDWEKAGNRHDMGTVEGILFSSIREMIRCGRKIPYSPPIYLPSIDTGNKAVFAFHREDKMLVLANFSEERQVVNCNAVNWFGLPWELHDLIQGKTVPLWDNIVLGPYEYLWLA